MPPPPVELAKDRDALRSYNPSDPSIQLMNREISTLITNNKRTKWREHLSNCSIFTNVSQDWKTIRAINKDTRPSSQEAYKNVVLRSDCSIPLSCSIYYFEITVVSKSTFGNITVGLSSFPSPTEHWPVKERRASGYQSDTGHFFHQGVEMPGFAPPFSSLDVIGCGVNLSDYCVFFTKNGILLSQLVIPNIISDPKRPMPRSYLPLYPCLAMACQDSRVTVNFGQNDFTFNLDAYIDHSRSGQIRKALDAHCSDEFASLQMSKLVADYMLHNGYIESFKSLRKWKPAPTSDNHQDVSANQSSAAPSSTEPPVTTTTSLPVNEDDVITDLVLKRRLLLDQIVAGHYLQALDQLMTHFPSLMERQPSLAFVLKCHHLIFAIAEEQTSPYTLTSPKSDSSPIDPLTAPSPPPPVNNGVHSSSSALQPDVIKTSLKRLQPCGQSPESNAAPSRSVEGLNTTNGHSPSSCQAPARLRLEPPPSDCFLDDADEYISFPVYPDDNHHFRMTSDSTDGNLGQPPQTLSGTKLHHSHRHYPADLDRPPINTTTLSADCLGDLLCIAEPVVGQDHSTLPRAKHLSNSARRHHRRLRGRRQSPSSNGTDSRCQRSASPVIDSFLSPSVDNGPCLVAVRATDLDAVSSQLIRSQQHNSSMTNSTCNGGGVPPRRDESPSLVRIPSPTSNGGTTLKSLPTPSPDVLPPTSSTTTTTSLMNVVEYGRMLWSEAAELQQNNAITPSQLHLLAVAFGLIAYHNPFTSPFRKFLEPEHRERLADAVNSAIMQHLNQPISPIIDSALTFLNRSLIQPEPSTTTCKASSLDNTNNRTLLSHRRSPPPTLGEGGSIHPERSLNGPSLQHRSNTTGGTSLHRSTTIRRQSRQSTNLAVSASELAVDHRSDTVGRTMLVAVDSRRQQSPSTNGSSTSGVLTTTTASTTIIVPPHDDTSSPSFYLPANSLLSAANSSSSTGDASSTASRNRPLVIDQFSSSSSITAPRRRTAVVSEDGETEFSWTPGEAVRPLVTIVSNEPNQPITRTTADNQLRPLILCTPINQGPPCAPHLAGLFHPMIFADFSFD